MWLRSTPIYGKFKNEIVLGGLGLRAIKRSRGGREVYFRHRYSYDLKSAFS